ncbi:sortase [Streptomyces nigrescens]|uniref:sortase n=1 Tax=Streptomyces nigrescens TaxID=1920 RepID=UPI0036FCA33A
MPENTPATDTAEPASSDTAQKARARRNLLIGAALATAVAAGLTVVRWSSADAAPTSPKAAAAASPSATAKQDPIASSRPSAHKADHTAKSADQASKTLHKWRESNPAGDSKHSVSDAPDLGVGGNIREVLRIPDLGPTWAQPVYEGTGEQQLRSGLAHFDGTQEPGELGNFAVAGHRSGVANPPFRQIDRLKVGSQIIVTTADRNTFAYTVTKISTVAPTKVDVLYPVPGHPEAQATNKLMTIVTCWPANGHSRRVIVQARLTSARGGV